MSDIKSLHLPVGLEIIDDFESSSLLWFGYDPDTALLYVGFKPKKENESGAVYEYNAVPDGVVISLISTVTKGESVGKAFGELVKKGGYTYQRIDQPVEEEVKATEQRARILRGVPVGMLWFDNNKTATIEDRAQRAIDFYIEKYGASYSQHFLVAVHSDMIPDEFKPEGEFDAISDQLSSFTFYADPMISPDFFLVSEAKI